MRATTSNTGMFILKIDGSASQVSARASNGVANNNAFAIMAPAGKDPTNPVFCQIVNIELVKTSNRSQSVQ